MAKLSWSSFTKRENFRCQTAQCPKTFKSIKALESHERTHDVFRSYSDRRYAVPERTEYDSRGDANEVKAVKEIRSWTIPPDRGLRLVFVELARRDLGRSLHGLAISFDLVPRFLFLVNDAIFVESKRNSGKTWTAFKDALYCCASELMVRASCIELHFLNFEQRLCIRNDQQPTSKDPSDLRLFQLEHRLDDLRQTFRSTAPLSQALLPRGYWTLRTLLIRTLCTLFMDRASCFCSRIEQSIFGRNPMRKTFLTNEYFLSTAQYKPCSWAVIQTSYHGSEAIATT